jgi:hypothetical protein
MEPNEEIKQAEVVPYCYWPTALYPSSWESTSTQNKELSQIGHPLE